MPNRRELIHLLEAAGSTKLFDPHAHIRYKLPNGRLFIASGTPSDQRSYDNALAFLRRELRSTHPELAANFGRSLPKAKRTVTAIESALSPVAKELHLYSEIPPDPEPAPLPEAECFVADDVPEATPAVSDPPPILVHHAPRMQREPKPRPSAARTLSPEQLAEANRILRLAGGAAMNAYLNRCRMELVDASIALSVERCATPCLGPMVLPENRYQPPTHNDGEDPMNDLLERARTELEATNARLSTYAAQIDAIRLAEEKDILRQAALEQYIVKHEQLASEAATLLQDILPPAPAKPKSTASTKPAKPAKQTSTTYAKLPYGMKEIRTRVFPLLREHYGTKEFNTGDALHMIERAGLSPLPGRTQFQAWLFNELRQALPQIAKGSVGHFRFSPAPHTSTPQSTPQYAESAAV